MKKRLLALLLAALMVLSMAACAGSSTSSETPSSQEPASNTTTETPAAENNNGGVATAPADPATEELADEQVFHYYMGSEPSTLDPWMNNSGSASIIIAAIHEPMLRPSLEGEGWEPGLCDSYEKSEDSTVHTLHLREGAKWEDGTDITVEDIYNSYLRVLNPELGSSIAYRYFPILNAEEYYMGEATEEELGIKILDGNLIQFTTKKPYDYFVDMMTADGFAPVQTAAAEAYGDMYGTDVDKIVASGPFKLVEWTHNNSMVLEKNENYWDADNVKLETLDVTITVDQNTIMGMFQNGELSLFKVGNELLPQYADDPTLETDTRLKVTFIEFNPRNEFLANKNIREAFSIAFDRQIFAEQVMHNGKLAAYGLVPYGVRGVDGGDFREQNGNIVTDASDPSEIQRAQELLATGLEELGKTVEELQEGFSIQCLESGKTQAQAIQNMWKTNLGVEMPVSVVDFNVLLPMLMEGTFDCVIGGGQDSNYRDPEGFMNFIYEEGKWDDPEFLALMEKVQTQTGDERIQTWMEIERLVLENFIYIPQVYAENNWVFQSNVRGLKIFTYGYEMDFKDVYLVKE